MNKIHPLFTYFIILIVTVNLTSCTKQIKKQKQVEKPNIILINVDDLGCKDLGVLGSNYYETPNIDTLAQEGVVFINSYAAAANCAPSRACMLSGLNTPRHGVFTVSPSDRGDIKTRKIVPIKNTKHLNDTIFTLPEMLKSAGYITSNFGKWHVGNNPLNQGIDINVGGSSRGNPGKGGYFSPYKIDNITDGSDGEYLTDRLTDEAINFVVKHKDTTFFVYLPYYTVHTPIMGKEKLIEKFKNKKGSNGQNRAEYAAMVSSMDENVGRLLSALKEEGLDKNTLIIFTSDNGGIRAISNQNPFRAGKGSYYEGGIRVPLIVKWPKIFKPNTISDKNVSSLDFYPTLQNIVKPQKKQKTLDGIDLLNLINNKELEKRDLFFHFPIYLQNYSKGKDQGRDPLFRTRPGSVIISGHWKLHHYFEDNDIELYNLKDDRGEKHNVADLHPNIANELYKKLDAWRLKTKAPIPTQINPYYSVDFEKKKTGEFLKNEVSF